MSDLYETFDKSLNKIDPSNGSIRAGEPDRAAEGSSAYIGMTETSGFKDFDAVVDANGRGNFTKITDALNAKMRRIRLNSGTFVAGEDLIISEDNTLIEGIQRDATVINCKSTHRIVINANNVTLRNFSLDNSVAAQYQIEVNGTGVTIDGIKIDDQTTDVKGVFIAALGGKIRNCDISVYTEALSFDVVNTGSPEIENNAFTVAVGYAVDSYAANTYMRRNYITVTAPTDTTTGAVTIRGQESHVTGNFLTCALTNQGLGIDVQASDVVIESNDITQFYNGIYVQSGLFGVTVSKNPLRGQGAYGITVISPVGVGFGFHTIALNTINGVGANAISISDGYEVSVLDNQIFQAAGAGIAYHPDNYRDHGLSELTINGNTITDCGGHGIAIDCGEGVTDTAYLCSYLVVVGNKVLFNAGWGINSYHTASVISSNVCHNNGAGNFRNAGAVNSQVGLNMTV